METVSRRETIGGMDVRQALWILIPCCEAPMRA